MAMASDYQANHRELWELWCFLGIPGINFDEKGVPLFQKPPNDHLLEKDIWCTY